MSHSPGRALFREEQRWGTAPAILLTVGGLLMAFLVVIRLGWGVGRQLLLGRPWGTDPAPNSVLLVVALIALPLGLMPLWLLLMRMIVEVYPGAVVVCFWLTKPAIRFLGPHRIPVADVVGGQVGREFPFGWGHSRTFRRLSYRINGTEGVELTLRNGRTVFIGSQRPRELLAAIREPRPSGPEA